MDGTKMSRQRKGTRGMNGAGFGMLLDDKCFWKAKNLPLLYFDLCEKGEMGINNDSYCPGYTAWPLASR